PITELTRIVRTPTLGSAGTRQRAAVHFPGRDGLHAAREAGDVDRGMALGPRPIPELAVAIISPTLGATAARHRAGVTAARSNRLHAVREAGDVDRGMAIGGRS